MQRLPEISKTAFLARINFRAGRFAINTTREMIDGQWRLVIIYNDGEREIFAGLKAA